MSTLSKLRGLNKISYKIFLGMVLLSSVILIIMTFMVTQSYTTSLKKNEINYHVQTTSRTKYQFDFIISVLENAAREISSNERIIAFLNTPPDPAWAKPDFTVNAYLQSLQTIQPFLGDITILGGDGQFCSSSTALRRADMEALFEGYVTHFEEGGVMEYFVNPSPSPYPSAAFLDVLTGIWPIFDIKSHRLLGVIFLGLNYTFFQEMFILPSITNNEKFVMIDSRGKILFSHPPYESFEPLLAAYPRLLTKGDRIIQGDVGGVDSVIVSETSANLGLKFIRIIDSKTVTTDTRKMRGYFNAVFIVSIVISLAFSMYISATLTKPVKQLFEACKRIEKGDLSFRVDITSGDELGQLGSTFNLIMDTINAYFERELVEQKRQNELKLEILRSQINPHFLYNTLDSIKLLATLQEIHNIASMCSSLISLLKYNLSSSTLAALGEEVESVLNYVSIQKYRYGDIFELRADILKETEPCVISRFVLQPLVENCFIHGFDDTERDGEIIIRSFFDGDSLCLEVSDNGRGMDRETLDRINRGQGRRTHYGSIGVNNIRERLRLQFGDAASLVYTSSDGAGTTAALRFPVVRKTP